MRKILVTAISGDIANGILKLLQDGDAELYGCDIFDYPVGMDRVKDWFISKPAVDADYISDILEHCKAYGITHLIPANEVEIKVISDNRERFEKANIIVLINSAEIINVFQNKYETSQVLSNIPLVSVPQTYMYDEFVGKNDRFDNGRKYIVKLNNSCGSKFLEVVDSKELFDDVCESVNTDEIVVQEYIDVKDAEYTVGVFSDGSNVSTIAFRRKLKHGYTSFVELVYDDSIKAMAESIARATDLRGYINIQLRKRDGKNYVFEINARISGSVYFQYALGHDVVNWWLDLLDGKADHVYTEKYKRAIGIRELTEKYVLME